MGDKDERAHRRATAEHVAGSIAHELRGPLSTVRSSVYLLRQKIGSVADLQRHLDKIDRQVDACEGVIADILDLEVGDNPPRPVSVGQLLDDALESCPLPSTVQLHRSLPADLRVLAQRRLLARAIGGVLRNAIRALGEGGGQITVEASADGGIVALSITDDGPGFPEELLADVFTPYVSGHSGGIGLGLTLVRRICDRHGGHVTASNVGGARLTMYLPPADRTDGGR